MTVTVVVAACNQLSTLPLTLRSMARQTVAPAMAIVADDGSCDGTREWLDASSDWPFPLRYVTHPHFGYGLTVIENLAASFVEEGRILFTNADVVHHHGSVKAHAKMPASVVAGGRVKEMAMPASGRARVRDVDDFSRFERLFEANRGEMSNHEFVIRNPGSNLYGIWGGNFSVDAGAFRKAGMFNERYRLMYGGEEADLVKRLVKCGVVPTWAYNSTAYHLAHPSRAYGQAKLGNVRYRLEHFGIC